MNDWWNLPSGQQVDRTANWGLITAAVAVVAAGVPIGLSMVGLPVAATIVIFGVLTIPVLLCLGNTIRHAIRSLKLRKREQREGRIVYSSRIGRLLDQHQYAVASLVIGGALLVALIWTLLEKK
jgi:hypothetical protein